MRWLSMLLLAPLAACAVGPDYKQPELATPPMFEDAPVPGATPVSAVMPVQADLSQWWRQFGDEELNRLVSDALAANLDLQTAASRIRVARQQEIIQGAAGLPNVNATGAALRFHSNSSPLSQLSGAPNSMSSGASGGTGTGGMAAAPKDGTDLQLFSAGFDATWEIDIFGGVRRSVEAARATREAAVWELHDAEVSLTAEVANDYLMLRVVQTRVAIIEDELKRQTDTLSLISARARTGFVTELDVNQQTAQVEATRAQLPPLQAQARAMIHALGVLLGREPEAMTAELSNAAAIPNVPAALPVGLPSDLLRRRPDVREAERKLAAATAQIGVAVAQLYPKFNLIGLASFASPELGGLLSAKNFGAGGAGLITWPIFDAGKLRAGVRSSEEQEKQAYLAYQESVLKALQDAEDALARYGSEQQRLLSLERSIAAASSSFTIAQDQYRAGLTIYVNVLTAQTTLLTAEDQTAQSRAQLATDLVSLYKALGGGWTET